MRFLTSGLMALALLVLSACNNSEASVETEAPAQEAPAQEAPATVEADDTFGAAFDADGVITAGELLVNYDEQTIQDTVATTLRATVDAVCQAKGCWMTVAAGEETEMMVKFKDYGFFVPKDISGREVIMQGIAYYEVTPVDELRHYAEDAGETPEKIAMITEPKRELKFLADGVKLVK